MNLKNKSTGELLDISMKEFGVLPTLLMMLLSSLAVAIPVGVFFGVMILLNRIFS